MRTEPTQYRSRNRRQQIMRAAEVVIAEKGVLGFTTQDVANEAGCAIGTVYRYFGGRTDIIDSLVPLFSADMTTTFHERRHELTHPKAA